MRNPFKKIKSCNKMLEENGVCGFKKFIVFFDLIYCKKRFHATYNEYFLYNFQNLKNSVRKNYLLTYHQRAKYPLVDGDFERKLGSGKDKQYMLFEDMLKREWFNVKAENLSEVESFIKKHGKVVFKPVHGSKGRGIFSVSAEEIDTKLAECISKITEEEYICEEYLVQHPKMNEMNPNSVNTVRIMTLCDGKNVKIISAALRTATDNNVCDNISTGGFGAAVDIETGVIFSTGCDAKKNRYSYHPVSNAKIKGFTIPYWNETKEMVKDGALRINKTAIVGWDIAISSDGPCFIEANNRPAGRPAQISSEKPCGEEIIKYINKNKRKYYKKMPKGIKQLQKKYG
ncbi:MAG: hypothetical protein IKT38_00575 [Clostridia bacterium]|nr:hypothetical protein [Clostridia bacterium]